MPKGMQGFQKGHSQLNSGRTHFKKGRKHTPINMDYLKGENNHLWKGGDIVAECLHCHNEFTYARNGKRDNNKRKFCSHKCSNVHNCARGKDHYCYKDGSGYEPYCKEFVRIREKIRARDNWHCRGCGVPQEEFEKALDVHHIDGDRLNNDPENLITLCRKCHGIAKKEMRRNYVRNRL